MRRRFQIIGWALALLLVLGVAYVLLSSSTLRLERGASGDGALSLETDLPLMTCRKVLSGRFPFVSLRCDPRDEAEGGARPLQAPSQP